MRPKFICSVEGCDEPRHQYTRQRVKWCLTHAREHLRDYERTARKQTKQLNGYSLQMAQSILWEPKTISPVVTLPWVGRYWLVWRIA